MTTSLFAYIILSVKDPDTLPGNSFSLIITFVLGSSTMYINNGTISPRPSSALNVIVSHGSIMLSKYPLQVGGPGSIPTANTIITSVDGDAEHVSLNHRLASPYQGVKLVLAKT